MLYDRDVSIKMGKRIRYIDVYASELTLDILRNMSQEDLQKRILETYELARKVGYGGCVLTIRLSEYTRDTYAPLKKFEESVRATVEEGILVFSRCHIVASRQTEIKRILRDIRVYCDLVSLSPQDRQLISFSSRDHRVDILNLLPEKTPPLFSGDIKELRTQEKFVEVTISSLFTNGTPNPYKIRVLREPLKLLMKKKVPIIISTGPQEHYTPRDPRALISFAKIFWGLDQAKLTKDLTENIYRRIYENRMKKQGKIPIRGVEIEN